MTNDNPTDTNQASEDELERKLMDLFCRSEYFGRTFLTSTTKEEFADAVNKGALDHQEAAHEATKLIRTEKLKLLDEVIHQSTVNLKSAKAVAGWAELRKKQLEAEL